MSSFDSFLFFCFSNEIAKGLERFVRSRQIPSRARKFRLLGEKLKRWWLTIDG